MEAHRDREVKWDMNRDRIEVLADENSVVARERGRLKKLIRKETNDVVDCGSDDDDDDHDDDDDDLSSCFLFVRSLQCKREIQRQTCP